MQDGTFRQITASHVFDLLPIQLVKVRQRPHGLPFEYRVEAEFSL